MLTHQDIIERCSLLAAGGWHPNVAALYWWSDTGWELQISLNDWIRFGTPGDELPYVPGLPVPYFVSAPTLASVGFDGELPPGVSLAGGGKAPDYVEPFDAPGYAWQEQAEAVIRALWQEADGDDSGDDRGYLDLRHTPYASEHSWARCRVWRWESEQMHEHRGKYRQSRGEAMLARVPTQEQPLVFHGRRMSVYRPCGCVTDHWCAPGKGRTDGAGKRRFGGWLARTPCLQCYPSS